MVWKIIKDGIVLNFRVNYFTKFDLYIDIVLIVYVRIFKKKFDLRK